MKSGLRVGFSHRMEASAFLPICLGLSLQTGSRPAVVKHLGPTGPLLQIEPLKFNYIIQTEKQSCEGRAPPPRPTGCRRDSHSHPIQELLRRLAVDGNGHPGISIKGELQAVEDAGLLAILGGAVSTIFVPAREAEGQAGEELRLQDGAYPAQAALPGCTPPF